MDWSSNCDITGGTVINPNPVPAVGGLSKDEYIALELTKAWASTHQGGYLDSSDIVEVYRTFLKRVEVIKN